MEFINHTHHNPHMIHKIHNHNEPCVVLIYADWCPHCQMMAPEWNDATPDMEENVKVIKIESNELPAHEEMLQAHNAHNNGYPTIYAFKPGQEPIYYGGERKKQSFISWVKKLFPMSKKKVTKKKTANKKKATKKKRATKKKSGGFVKEDQVEMAKNRKKKRGKKGDSSKTKSK